MSLFLEIEFQSQIAILNPFSAIRPRACKRCGVVTVIRLPNCHVADNVVRCPDKGSSRQSRNEPPTCSFSHNRVTGAGARCQCVHSYASDESATGCASLSSTAHLKFSVA